MTDRPILMSAPMVRASLSGTKTQTRRVVKLPHMNPLGQWEPMAWGGPNGGRTAMGATAPAQTLISHSRTGEILGCPYGQPGDRLWVKETFARIDGQTRPWIETDYRATYTHGDRLGDTLGIKKRWTPSIFMPRHASRITLEVTGVRVERLQDISESDARAEGVSYDPGEGGIFHVPGLAGCASDSAVDSYRKLWEQINGPESWAANPWVWVVEFK